MERIFTERSNEFIITRQEIREKFVTLICQSQDRQNDNGRLGWIHLTPLSVILAKYRQSDADSSS
jgi:hypothetical protein